MALSKMKFAYFVLVAVQAAFALPQQNPTSTAVSRPSSTSLPAGASAGAPSAPGSSAVPQPGATFPGPGAPLVPGAPQGAPAGAGPGASAGPPSGNATGAHGPPGAAGAAGAAAAAAAGAGGQPGGDPTPRPGAPRGLNFLGKPNPIFFYEPDYSIAVGAVAVFFISFCLHAVALFTFKSWYFMVLAQAPLIDVVAAVARVFAVTHPGEMTPYVINMMCWSIPVSLVGIGLIFTSTRFILWVTPLDRLNVGTLLVSPIHISAIWGMLFVFPDIAKGVTAQMGKPKEGKHPNSTDIFHRIEATAGSFQFVFFGLFTLWFIRFMTISKNFAVPIEISSRPWRRFGWIIVVGNLLLTVCILYTTRTHYQH